MLFCSVHADHWVRCSRRMLYQMTGMQCICADLGGYACRVLSRWATTMAWYRKSMLRQGTWWRMLMSMPGAGVTACHLICLPGLL